MEFFDISMAFLMKIWLNSEVLHTKHWQATLLFLEKFLSQRKTDEILQFDRRNSP